MVSYRFISFYNAKLLLPRELSPNINIFRRSPSSFRISTSSGKSDNSGKIREFHIQSRKTGGKEKFSYDQGKSGKTKFRIVLFQGKNFLYT